MNDADTVSESVVASRIRLPPSPEPRILAVLENYSDENSDGESPLQSPTFSTKSRLRSIASYESFHPQALACSLPLHDVSGYSGNETPEKTTDVGAAPRPLTSLGAVAGADGVALFYISKPHVPLLMLSHDAGYASPLSVLTSLKFQQPPTLSNKSSSILWLASARGSGVLVWDASGHSLSPLQGRLSVEAHETISSLTWIPGESSWLAATTATSAFLWDLRDRTSMLRPSLRFGTNHNSTSSMTTSKTKSPQLLQIACNQDHESAVLDAAGTVRVYDTRLTDRSTRMGGDRCQFQACQHAGVGLAFLPLKKGREHCWVTWGLDEPNADAIVKVWKSGGANVTQSGTTGENLHEDYWYLDSSPNPKHYPQKHSVLQGTKETEYRLVGQCTTYNLACARVCPFPVQESIITVGLSSGSDNSGTVGWRVELWKLKTDDIVVSETTLERVVTFESSTNRMDQNLKAIMGEDAMCLRSLRASELALSSCSESIPFAAAYDDSKDTSFYAADYGLLLCCLTEKGYVTTHAIAEALPEMNDTTHNRLFSFQGTSDGNRVAAFSLSPPKKWFPAQWEGAVADAASMWAKPFSETAYGTSNEKGSAVDLKELTSGSIGSSMHRNTSLLPTSTILDEGVMPFNMDVPVAYSMANAGIIATVGMNEMVSPNAGSSADEKDQLDRDVIDAAIIMDSIETDRMPCPRLCGATFSSGVGGLAVFQNGNVKKMWHWWESSDLTRLASVPGLIGEGSVPNSPISNCPRTLNDLTKMICAAKEAQWGEHDESDVSSTGFPASGNFFEDESDADASSDSGEDTLVDDFAEVSESKRLPQSEFPNPIDDHFQPMVLSSELLQGERLEDASRIDVIGAESSLNPAVGPSSDMLTPVVKVSHSYDRVALNSQNRSLALGWKLGDFIVPVNILGPEGVLAMETKTNHSLPSYNSYQKPRNITNEEERGVHGGEYSVRPNMQESMVFLRKLFSHQKQVRGNVSFSNLMSPPDSPLLPNNFKAKNRQSLTNSPTHDQKKRARSHLHLGVYTLAVNDVKNDEQLTKIVSLCLHNAKVSHRFGEVQKMETWNLIANIVRSRAQCSSQGFDGWGGGGGGALGVGLVGNILRYYETLGDVQMLSTLICVLRDRRRTLRRGEQQGWFLLSPDQALKYDTYIRRYADLLYGWRLLTLRTELNKHLIRSFQDIEVGFTSTTETTNESRVYAHLSFLIRCPRCGTIVNNESGANYCESCQDYAFRCALCDQAVHGVFTFCECCGHGGHLNHIREWFFGSDVCPTGCGCKCRFASTSLVQNETDLQQLLPLQ